MIVVMKVGSPEAEIARLTEEFVSWGLSPEKIVGKHKVVIGLVGETVAMDPLQIQEASAWIEQVLRVEQPFKRASREYRNGEASEVAIPTPNGVVYIGEHHPIVTVAGPCSVENEEMIIETARRVKAAGAQFLRGGAFKPRTSPYAFQGHGESALGLLAAAREATGLGIITELMDASDLEPLAEIADVIQIGARNMQNFSLLKKVGAQDKPILLKRGMAATIEDWLMAAEYILAAGNPNVILCERGIRTFDRQYARNTLDLSAIPVLRTLTHLPIMIDPSHGTGRAEYVPSMAMASIAAGTDSLMIEVHPNPKKALSDGPQSLTPDAFDQLMRDLAIVGKPLGRWTEQRQPVGV
ncbi:phospho-2-dehydro-3-deoxyheptonate aldolase [Leptolyngbya boryana NIES-2135]|jgi:3-deoxy-7-phosphoheptulonate synthase|uniref:Phospho-2-dehydro-3-deoxyheptonate aldolase n=1 Tax=Leptolyngbya boryana NIES-2135 TaxID=1973484 RepID=A0A1Z4JE85_LEPBY|nr:MULTISPECIES: 3-deoxy-7-phosphoheptulonate synthase [Leptolyngbya]BAY55082.1 phospho-2-dehydro-3-deoxyheptonate aldolase [Leptolyngbya boryana NIES-2135]MBD2366062.1 3-deoxy-7-phosphoheptulonate synthase [Leptolyngbya sp. FACHB-161]MBD2372242.1 3-deoxy-7-phosphoheptulonate synthase [Leptolyngbya sp. FACHB-238]MBD2396665.1 3-deoxy-7-phosphoheptulonate synthase [Leptolyngbya sp. FACHB-239]MBD2403188.1 3-deoxy-7-phosphoheptulonate synthase [Leptolyngbya sp. FACHB-402]